MTVHTYTLRNDGDDLERVCEALFLTKSFSAYELFWLKEIVPLSNRPNNAQLKTDSDLAKIGKTSKDICIAQLHYTVLRHLFRVYELLQIQPLDLEQFTEGIIRLCAGLDVADELLGRFTATKTFDPWSEKDGEKARRDWRKQNSRMQYVRDYRNRLLHGRVFPAVLLIGTYNRYRVPKFGKVNEYLDWRKVTNSSVGAGGKVRIDFDAPNNLLQTAWEDSLSYLESNWRSTLL